MFCPNCRCEYIRGVTECADCGVPLVPALESPESKLAGAARIVAIWRGNDPSERERAEKRLEIAGIEFTTPDSKSSFSFFPTEPSLEIWISEADQEAARRILDDLDDRADPDEFTPEELEALALPDSSDADDSHLNDPPPDLSQEWYDDDPVAEVWNGDSEEFAEALIACLREIGIASRKRDEQGQWRVVVRPEKESRAKEIVREVVEGRPQG